MENEPPKPELQVLKPSETELPTAEISKPEPTTLSLNQMLTPIGTLNHQNMHTPPVLPFLLKLFKYIEHNHEQSQK